MPLLLTSVLNYFTGGSPQPVDDKGTGRSDNTKPCKERNPRYTQGNYFNGEEQELKNNKKRTRSHILDENDEEVITNLQKKRRIAHSTSDEVEESTAEPVKLAKLNSPCIAQSDNIADGDARNSDIRTNPVVESAEDGTNCDLDELANLEKSTGMQNTFVNVSQSKNDQDEELRNSPAAHLKKKVLTRSDFKDCQIRSTDEGMDIDSEVVSTNGHGNVNGHSAITSVGNNNITKVEISVDKPDVDKKTILLSDIECIEVNSPTFCSANELANIVSDENNVTRIENAIDKEDGTSLPNDVNCDEVESTCQGSAVNGQTNISSDENVTRMEHSMDKEEGTTLPSDVNCNEVESTSQGSAVNGHTNISSDENVTRIEHSIDKEDETTLPSDVDCNEVESTSQDGAVNGHTNISSDETNNITRVETSVDNANGSRKLVLNDVDEANDNAQEVPTSSTHSDEDEEQVEESLIAQQIFKGVLTESMLDQEKKLHKQNMEEEKEIVNQAMAEWDSTIEQQRYNRLQHLLEQSNAYSEFLLQRIEKQKEENEKDKLKASKKAKNKDHAVEPPPQTVPDVKRPRRSNAVSSKYNITDYVDAEALKKNVQKSGSTRNHQTSCGNSSKSTGSSQTLKKNVQSPESTTNHDSSLGDSSKIPGTSQNETSSYVQPVLLSGGTLRDYQIEGVEWLKVLFENGVNGILADEMGLGKTIQCIALLAHLIENDVRGPFLVAAPLSTLPNWVAEFNKFTPTLPAILYHGNPDERTRLRKLINVEKKNSANCTSFPVVITSYDIIMIDRKYLDKFMWKYLIVDEGHRIKNLKCKLLRELKAYPAANRLLLTGTPLQNNLSELWSLLNFLLPDVFDDLNSFQAWFDFSAINESGGNEKIIAQEREHHVLQRLHDILTPFLLRRLKNDVNLDLPRKKEVIVYAPLTKQQEQWYTLFLDKTRVLRHFEKKKDTGPPVFSPSGRSTRSCSRNVKYDVYDDDSIEYGELMEKLLAEEERKREVKERANRVPPPTCERHVKLANILMLLRKTCNHPYLVEYPLVVETGDYRIDEEVITSCGKTLVLDQMLSALKERGHKVLLFSQMTTMLNILEDFCYLRSYQYCRIDGSTKLEDRQIQIKDFNTDPSVFIFLLSTRAGGLGLNLTAADTVILYDSDWNPQSDLQAQDRCHRIGQTRPVVVYRYLTANTVDQRIVERANEKRKLEKMIIHKGKFKGVRDCKTITTTEMLELLQSSDHMDAINTENNNNTEVLSKEALDKLLDRSDLLRDVISPVNENEQENKLFKVVGIAE